MTLPPEDQAILDALLDPAFFIESSLSIVDKDSKKSPFLLNVLQKRYLAERSRRDIILKSRKMGFSTLIISLWLHACITRKNTKAVIVSHDKESTQRMLERLKYMVENSIYPIKCEITKNGAKFPDSESTLWIGTAGSRKFGRGDDITHCHLTEPAFYEHLDIITSVSEAMVNDSWLVLESTANGAGTPYHDLWIRSTRGETNFKTHFFGWHEDPTLSLADARPVELDDYERKAQEAFNLSWGQIAWRRKKLRDMEDPTLFYQEFPATPEEAFLASGRMVFDWDAIKAQEDAVQEPKWQGFLVDRGSGWTIDPNTKGPLTVWKGAEDKRSYLVIFDSSQGVKGGDYCVADVFDVRTWEQVAQWRGHAAPDKFADIAHGLGCMYNWAPIAGENNYPGNAVLLALQQRRYPNLWTDPSGKAMDREGGKGEPGFKTTERTKSLMISDLRQALRDMDIRINALATLSELKSYVILDDGTVRKDHQKMGAQAGCHDDTVITAAAAAYILKRWTLEPEDHRAAMKDHFKARWGILRRRQAPTWTGSQIV